MSTPSTPSPEEGGSSKTPSNSNSNNTSTNKLQLHNPDLYDKLDQSSFLFTPPGATSRKKFAPHDFAGYGSYHVHHTPRKSEMELVSHALLQLEEQHAKHHLLQQLEATAISGNDILSSTFYVSGLVSLSAGVLAPLCLALVGGVLYLFRAIYHETVMALPCNGGTYNILLNCTSKQVASMAAIFAIISYITTGVVSALEAVAYLQTVLDPFVSIHRESATIGLLAFFCVITNLGMKESATVAKVIFVAHVATLSVLTVLGTLHVVFRSEKLFENWSANTPSFPSVDMAGRMVPGTVGTALFYGFASAMLGVSGFETSSQFVEEQAPGVFPKTLRNMWWGIMVFNPLLSLISFSALTLEEIVEHHDTVLARTADVVGNWIQQDVLGIAVDDDSSNVGFGRILSTIVSIDAFVVLAAALLTGYIGINGLIRRMAMDRCLPQIFLLKNPWTNTDSVILVSFFVLCLSQVVILKSNVEALGGVYCYAFLTVMVIFAYGNILLKIKRPSLPREVTTGWVHSIAGLVAVVLALLGNVLGKPELLTYFFVYFLIVGVIVLLMFQKTRILRLLFKLLKPKKKQEDEQTRQGETKPLAPGLSQRALWAKKDLEVNYGDDNELLADDSDEDEPSGWERGNCLDAVSRAVRHVEDVPFIFYCKHADLYLLNKAMKYIQRNEQTNKIIVVNCKGGLADSENNTSTMTENVKLLDRLYPRVKISLLTVNAEFSPVTVEWLSHALNVPVNAMFISCPDEKFKLTLRQLRGMRIIFSYD
eukprot:scaffold5479_cov199-Amphora_coffeaeformis.AAC.97